MHASDKISAHPLQHWWQRAWADPWRESSSRSFLTFLVALFGWFLIAVSGYFLTYQLFFTQTSLFSLAPAESTFGGEKFDFRFDGVSYFHGHRVKDGDAVTVTLFAPWVLSLGKPTLEIFIETADRRKPRSREVPAQRINPKDAAAYEQSLGSESAGVLQVDGWSAQAEPAKILLTNEELQRYVIAWRPEAKELNTLRLTYHAGPGDADGAIAFAVIVHSHLWVYALLFLALGVALLCLESALLSHRKKESSWRRWRYGSLWLLPFALLAFYIHSGAMISNLLFEGHHRIGSKAILLLDVLETGQLRASGSYEEIGMQFLPAILLLIEQTPKVLERYFTLIYPGTRHLIFVFHIASVLFLSAVLRKTLGLAVAVIFTLLAILHYPFILDLYDAHADAHFFFLFPFFVALFLRLVFSVGNRVITLLLMGLTMVFVGALKPNMAFVVLTAPIAVLIARWEGRKNWKPAFATALTIFLVLVAGLQVGRVGAAAFQPSDRHVGIEGEKFYDSNFWAMIWAAYGHVDPYSAHWFAKGGAERNKRFSERLNLPNKGLLRHSATASDAIYKPETKNALRERPDFFYSTAFLRAYVYGLHFFRYTYGKDAEQFWVKWEKHGNRGKKIISGQEVTIGTPEREAIRYGEAWKISPLLLLAKITQVRIPFAMDLVLLALAIAGVCLIRCNAVRFFFLSAVFVQIAFWNGIHPLNRYFGFVNVILLIGLAYILSCAFRALYRASPQLWSFGRRGYSLNATVPGTPSNPATPG